jgi:hypothetical protein
MIMKKRKKRKKRREKKKRKVFLREISTLTAWRGTWRKLRANPKSLLV